MSSQDDESPIVLPFDENFRVQTNTSRGFSIEDVYHVDFEAEPLAGGGFGTVYQCCHLFVHEMPVAVKRLRLQIRHADFDADQDQNELATKKRLIMGVEEQVTEIAILKEFRDSPHIIHLHEYFVQADQANAANILYIVTEFLQGGELFHCIADRNRDGQPFSEQDIRGEPTSLKLADFGQSKMLREDEDKTRTCTGTPGYRCPEMFLRQEYNELSDMFSAGVILFFLLAGYQPFSSYPKSQIEAKTIRCEYRQNVDSWNRVSKKAKHLVKRLLTRAEYRLSVAEALNHDWMQHDEHGDTPDLTENARAIARSIREERKLEREMSLRSGSSQASDAQANSSSRLLPNHSESQSITSNSLPRNYANNDESDAEVDVTGISTAAERIAAGPMSATNDGDGIVPSVAGRVDDQDVTVVSEGPPVQPPVIAARLPPRVSNNFSQSARPNCCSYLFPFLSNDSSDDDSESSESRRNFLQSGISSLGVSLESSRVRYSTQDDSMRSGRMRSDSPDNTTPQAPGYDHDRLLPISDSSRRESDYSDNQTSSVSESTRRQVSFSGSSTLGRAWSPPVAFPAVAGLTFWEPSVLHVGSDFPRASKPLLNHITETLTASDYTEAAARRYCRMIFECVAGLHESNVVHRCITMTNLFVQKLDDGTERVILRNTPFTTNSVPGERSLTGYCGTPYRSTAPEVYSDFSYDEKVDLWSLGIVTYFLLCGIDPFHGSKDDVEVKRRSVYIEYPFSFDAPSREARAFVELLLQPDPVDRPSARRALEHDWLQMDAVKLTLVSLEFVYEGLWDWI
ncbi:hypothetical protein MPSEU_000996200 [Mayamaea pseudoterrestris]|nr:hypothetical protein MPSEU_000996200 [Mayamaea pseudoterrestris]